MNIKFFIALISVSCLATCKVADPLTIERAELTTNNLKINGYYNKCDQDYCYPFYLFENGIYLDCGAVNLASQEIIDSVILDSDFIERLKRTQYGWGVFKVSKNEISIEQWLPGVGGPYPTKIYSGQILNDTTILISGLRGTKYKDEIDTFRFRPLPTKPDSTNTFVK